MKKITELEEQEILNLSPEDIDLMIKFRKAEEGIKLIKHPIKFELEKIPEPDITVYSLWGFNNILFTDIKECQAFADTINMLKTICTKNYKGDIGYNIQYKSKFSKEDNIKINSEKIYSKEIFDTYSEIIKVNNKKETKYNELLKEYRENYDNSKYIEDEIYNRINEVRDKYNNLERYSKLYEEYLVLANGDSEVAINFLSKAYKLTENEITDIFKYRSEIISQ